MPRLLPRSIDNSGVSSAGSTRMATDICNNKHLLTWNISLDQQLKQVSYFILLSLAKSSEIQYLKKAYIDRHLNFAYHWLLLFICMYPSREFICIVNGYKYIIWNCILSLAVAIDTEFYVFKYKIVSIVYINQQIDYDMKGMNFF